MNLTKLKKAELISKIKESEAALIEARGAYIDDVNQERAKSQYLLMALKLIKFRVAQIKKKSSPRSFKFWLRLLLDKELRNAVRAIIEFDYDYIESKVTDNGGERLELSDGLPKLGSVQAKKES